ncbi:hypothetical protein EMCG_02385 [[Emmonsia] crescens]|uniref:Uncharacterized protein n=1 Tax=[Emmonsia] crescens TaxID=73230 RepID=A0A0G2HZI7_9EURO|nr:hypothetical protein EMCG_02385 [Emmonsia crescens UAMH 3008]
MTDSDLTPIRVKGKRYKKSPLSTDKNATQKGRTRSSDKNLPHRRSGRPIKKKCREKIASRGDKRVKVESTKICHLEALPVELIEKIFLDSLELNLARASPRFGAILSRKRVYKILTFLAFFKDSIPKDNSASEYISNILRPLEYVPLDINAQKSLQNDVLSCRWFNLPLFKECQRDMFYSTLQKFVFGPQPCGIGMVLDTLGEDILNDHLNEDPVHWKMSFQGTDGWNKSRSLYIYPQRVAVTCDTFGILHFFPMVVWTIPDKFFAGQSWTEEKFRLLHYLLVFTPYGLSPDAPEYLQPSPSSFDISRDRIQDCIHYAIMEGNVWILSELLSWDEMAHPFRGRDPSGYGIRGEHFVTAVKRSEDPGLLQVLLRAHAESIPYDDPDITAWALRQKNYEFGQWLLSYMIEVPARRRDRHPLFSGGWARRHARSSRHDFPDDPGCYIWWADFEKYVRDRLPADEMGWKC